MAAIDESLLFIHLTAAAIYGADLRIWVFMDPVIVTVNWKLELEGKCTFPLLNWEWSWI